MIKTTKKEILNNVEFTDFYKLKKHINEKKYKIIDVKKVAYCESLYGCGGYMLELKTKTGQLLTAFTNRSTWMYDCETLEQYNKKEV